VIVLAAGAAKGAATGLLTQSLLLLQFRVVVFAGAVVGVGDGNDSPKPGLSPAGGTAFALLAAGIR
jgi:hypothetical protein